MNCSGLLLLMGSNVTSRSVSSTRVGKFQGLTLLSFSVVRLSGLGLGLVEVPLRVTAWINSLGFGFCFSVSLPNKTGIWRVGETATSSSPVNKVDSMVALTM